MAEGWLQMDGWAGRWQQRVEVLGRTPKRVHIRAITSTRLAGRRGYLAPGGMALVPPHAVRDKPIEGVERIG